MTNRKNTISNIKASYTETKRMNDIEGHLWLYLILRRPSFYLTWIFLKMGISANQTTFLSAIVGLIGCVFLGFGDYWIKIGGVVLMNFCFILDCVDGNIARYRKLFSPFGEFIDALVGYVITAFLFMSLGVGVFFDPDSSVLLRHAEISPLFDREVFLFAGFWSSLMYVLTRIISLRHKTLFISAPKVDSTKVAASSRYPKIILIFVRNIFGTSGLFMPLFIFAVIFRFLGLLVLLYAVVNTIGLILIIIRTTMQSFRALKKEN